MAAKRKRLGAKDIERLENTSTASAFLAAGHQDPSLYDGGCGGLSCIGVSCYGGGATCVNGTAPTIECIGITCNGLNATIVVQTAATCGGGGGGGGCGLRPTCIDCSGASCGAGQASLN